MVIGDCDEAFATAVCFAALGTAPHAVPAVYGLGFDRRSRRRIMQLSRIRPPQATFGFRNDGTSSFHES